MKRISPIVIGLACGCLILIVFLFQFVRNLYLPMSLVHNDWYLLTFMMEHFMQTISKGDWGAMATYPMYYGFSNSVFFGEFFPLHVLLGYPLYALTHNTFLVTNSLVFLSVLFSFASMVVLSFSITRKVWPSVIAGIVYSVNPFFMGRFPDHLLVLNGGFLPLIFWAVDRMFKRPYRSHIGWVFVLLTGQLLSSTIYYSIFLTVLLPVYIIIRCVLNGMPEKNAVITPRALPGLVLFLFSIALVYQLYASGNARLYTVRSHESTAPYSANVSDWLFTAPNNVLYGRIKPWASKQFPSVVREGIYSEHNLFPGFIAIVLGALGMWVLFKQKKDPRLVSLAFVGILSFVLTFGPSITLTESLSLPGLYALIDAVNPLFGFLRVPARFGVFVFLSLSVFIAYGLSWMQELMSPKKYMWLLAGITLGILTEYKPVPFEFLTKNPIYERAYTTVIHRSDIHVIAEYPLGNSIDYAFPQARMEELDAQYLAFALLYHDKKLFNGYSGFIPREYQNRADYLSVHFPTRTKLSQLKTWGVDALVVHKNQFTLNGEYERVTSSLKALTVPILSLEKEIEVFDLTAWQADP